MSFRFEIRLRTRFLYFMSVFLNSWNIRDGKSRKSTYKKENLNYTFRCFRAQNLALKTNTFSQHLSHLTDKSSNLKTGEELPWAGEITTGIPINRVHNGNIRQKQFKCAY